MTCNVGGGDRMFRIIAGVVILGVGFYFKSYFGLIGIVPILTGLLRWCPAYIPFKINTCKTDTQNPN